MLTSGRNTYTLLDLKSKREFKTNVTRLVPFHFNPNRVDYQEVASNDSDEFLIESIL